MLGTESSGGGFASMRHPEASPQRASEDTSAGPLESAARRVRVPMVAGTSGPPARRGYGITSTDWALEHATLPWPPCPSVARNASIGASAKAVAGQDNSMVMTAAISASTQRCQRGSPRLGVRPQTSRSRATVRDPEN